MLNHIFCFSAPCCCVPASICYQCQISSKTLYTWAQQRYNNSFTTSLPLLDRYGPSFWLGVTLYCANVLYCTIFLPYCCTDCTVLYCTVLHCTVLLCTMFCAAVLYCCANSLLYVVYCTTVPLYCTVRHCTVLYCTVLQLSYSYRIILLYYSILPLYHFCITGLYCTVLHCSVLYCIILRVRVRVISYHVYDTP